MPNGEFVVKPHRPSRTRVLWVGLAVVAVLTAYLLLEYGKYLGGFNSRAAARERDSLRTRVAAVQADNTRLREKIALLETSSQVDREAYQRVESTLSQLESEIQKQREELDFYRGIVSPSDGTSGLRIQEMALMPGPEAASYRMRLVLVQANRHDRRVSGVVSLSIDGARDGEPVTIGLSDLDPDGGPIAFSFRYFQDFERDLVLPSGFVPDRVTVEVSPKGRQAKVIRQSFDWTVKS